MIEEAITPLEPRKFFSGIWHGEGELIPGRLNSWIVPREQIRFQSRPVWLSDTIWKVEERFEFSSGKVITLFFKFASFLPFAALLLCGRLNLDISTTKSFPQSRKARKGKAVKH